jgi:hypothetical protein
MLGKRLVNTRLAEIINLESAATPVHKARSARASAMAEWIFGVVGNSCKLHI